MVWFSREAPATVVGTVSIAHFLSHVFLLAYPPLFPLLAVEFGVSTASLGLLVTAIYVPQLLLQLPLGEVVDRVGAKWVLVSGLALTSFAIGISGLATSYWILLGCALLSGVGQSVFHPADYALIETVTTTDNQGTAFSAHTFGGFAGFAAAPLIIGTIGIAIDWQVALLGVGAVGVLAAAGVALAIGPVHAAHLRARSETEHATADEEDDSDDGALVRDLLGFVRRFDLFSVFLFYLVSMMALVGLQSFTTVLATDGYGFAESTANTLLTIHLTATAIGVIAGGPIADRVPFRRVLVSMLLLAAVGTLALAFGVSSGSYLVALLLATLVGLLFGLALPSRDKFANAIADPDAVGKSFGFFFTGLSLGAVVSPTLLGLIIDVWSPLVAFVVVGGMLAASAAVVLLAEAISRSTSVATAEPG